MIASTVSCTDAIGWRERNDEAADKAIADRADSYAFAWLNGRFNDAISDGDSLATIVSCQLCNVPGNELHTVLAVVQRAARSGDAEACNLIERLAHEHASAAYERGSLL